MLAVALQLKPPPQPGCRGDLAYLQQGRAPLPGTLDPDADVHLVGCPADERRTGLSPKRSATEAGSVQASTGRPVALLADLPDRLDDGPTGLSPEFEALRWFLLPPGCLSQVPADLAVTLAG